MSNTLDTGNCAARCWGAAAIAGVLALILAWRVGLGLGAVMLAIGAGLLIGLALTRIFCTRAAAIGAQPSRPADIPPAEMQAAQRHVARDAVHAPSSATPPERDVPELVPASVAPAAAAAAEATDSAGAAPVATIAARPERAVAVADAAAPAGGGVRPASLDAPGAGGADDLTRIKGIGPKLAALCHQLGIFHFAQIAEWGADQVAWMDGNLKGFRGRVSRDRWVAQARMLAAEDKTGFATRALTGDV